MNKHNAIGDRLKEWINAKELSASDFAKQVQIQRSALSHIFSGRNKPSVDVLLKIKNAYPEMNLDWLITGKIDNENKMEESIIKENTLDSEKLLVTDVNLIIETADIHDVNVDEEIKNKKNQNDRIVVRIIELYSDGSFKYYNS
jgi:transcriptional regulator with XRE-family HTH domain